LTCWERASGKRVFKKQPLGQRAGGRGGRKLAKTPDLRRREKNTGECETLLIRTPKRTLEQF